MLPTLEDLKRAVSESSSVSQHCRPCLSGVVPEVNVMLPCKIILAGDRVTVAAPAIAMAEMNRQTGARRRVKQALPRLGHVYVPGMGGRRRPSTVAQAVSPSGTGSRQRQDKPVLLPVILCREKKKKKKKEKEKDTQAGAQSV